MHACTRAFMSAVAACFPQASCVHLKVAGGWGAHGVEGSEGREVGMRQELHHAVHGLQAHTRNQALLRIARHRRMRPCIDLFRGFSRVGSECRKCRGFARETYCGGGTLVRAQADCKW